MDTDSVLPHGEKMRQAVKWISEICMEHPERTRMDVIFEAGERFDLSPVECEFLRRRLSCPENNA